MDRRRFLVASGLSSATAVAMAAGPAHAARTARTKTSPSLRIGAGFLSVGISSSGYVDSLVDLRNGTDHLAKDTPVPLVSVVADGKHVVPAKVRVVSRDRSHNRQVLEFAGESVTIQVEAVRFPRIPHSKSSA